MENEISNAFVCLMGVGVVFIGLICIIILCKLMSAVCRLGEKKEEQPEQIVAPSVSNDAIPNRQEFIAAVSAVIAEEMGADVSAIRITSVKRV